MASKSLLLVLACFIFINTHKVSSEWEEEIFTQGSALPSAGSVNYKSSSPSPSPSPATPPPKSPYVPPVTKPTPPPVKASPPPPPPPPPQPRNRQECEAPCLVRCKNHSRPNTCRRACLACCERCKCVPPGQYGNYEKCGKCYSEMTTHRGQRKCP